jgi:hypothetical protein
MVRDAVATLEEIRQKLIKKLLDKKRQIDDQLRQLGYKESTPE